MSQLKTSALALALLVWPAITRAESQKPDDAPQPKSPEESRKCFSLSEGFRIDFWRGNGDFNLTGMAFTAMGGEASYDGIELRRKP